MGTSLNRRVLVLNVWIKGWIEELHCWVDGWVQVWVKGFIV